MRLRLERLDDAARLAFVRERTGATGDPFSAAPGHGPGFLTFRLKVANESGGLAIFESQTCQLESRPEDARAPLDVATITAAYASIDRDPPQIFERLRPFLFDGTVFLEPGHEAEGLLVFRPHPGNPKRFSVVVPVTRADGARTVLKAAYRRRK